MTTSKTGYAILGVLSIEPMSGYGIREFMKENTSGFWAESDGQIYPAVKKLLLQQYVQTVKSELKNEKRKIVYEITQHGRLALEDWLKIDPEKNSVRDEFILKLFCGANVDTTINIDHLQKKIFDIKNALVNLTKIKNILAKNEETSKHYIYWDICIDYALTILQAKLQWCESVIKRLRG